MSITIILCVVTAIISFLGFSNPNLIEQLIFYPYKIWRKNEWHRLVSSGFIHNDITHLLFNMLALFSLGEFVEQAFGKIFPGYGITLYLIMYILAIVISDIYQLFSRKNDPSYRSLGASGGVSAVVFAAILLSPTGIKFYGIIPAFIFGPLFLLYTAYMAKRGGDNIGHGAHLAGAIFGFVFPILFEPSLLPYFFSQLFH